MRFDLTDLRLLVAAAEAGGIAAAARRANLSTSALSERFKALEGYAGVALFARGARGSTLTAAGEDLLAHARAVLLQADRLDAAVKAWRGHARGEIRLLANSTAIVRLLPDALAQFLAAYPEVSVDLREALTADILRAVRDRSADLGVVIGAAGLEGLEVLPFQRERLVLILPPGHRFAARRQIAFAEALGEPFVALDANAAIQTYIARQADALGVALAPRIRLRNFDAVARMVAAGVGVAVVSASTVTRALRDSGVRALELTDAWAVRDLVICHLPGELASPLARRLAAMLPRAALG